MILTLNTLPIRTYNPFIAAWRVLRAAVVQTVQCPTNFMPTVERLGNGATLALLSPIGRCVECLEGCVWVTLDGDSRDVVISTGQSFWPDRNARALIHALEESRVRVS